MGAVLAGTAALDHRTGGSAESCNRADDPAACFPKETKTLIAQVHAPPFTMETLTTATLHAARLCTGVSRERRGARGRGESTGAGAGVGRSTDWGGGQKGHVVFFKQESRAVGPGAVGVRFWGARLGVSWG